MESLKKSILQVVLAQGVVLLASLLKALVIPSVLTVDGFAYWQIYVLYSGFVGVFSLGFTDGIYLRYGGWNYDALPFRRLRGAFRIYMGVLALFSLTACILVFLEDDPNKAYALFFVGLDILAVGISGLLLYILQITNQIRSYSLFSICDKVLMIVLIGVIVCTLLPDFRLFIAADCFTKFFVCLLLLFRCKDLVIGKGERLTVSALAYFAEIRIGVNLLIANLAGMLAVNIGRFIIELFGDLSSYAYYSFGVSITNLVLTFVSAVALVLYPSLKRMDDRDLPDYFDKTDFASMKVSLIGFALYAPACLFVEVVLPKYLPLLPYLDLLFLAVVGQVKMQLLNNTYYKALRLEKRLLYVNVQSVLLFAVVGGIAYAAFRDVQWIAAATAAVLLARAWVSEVELRKRLKRENYRKLVFEVIFCILFLLGTHIPFEWVAYACTIGVSVLGFVMLVKSEKRKKPCESSSS